MSGVLAFVLVLLLAATPLAAQSVDTLAVAPGMTLRIVTRASTNPLTTTLRRQTAAGLVVDPRCAMCVADSTIVWSALQTVDVRMGRRHGMKSALIGAGVGLVAGTLIGAVAIHQDTQDCKSNHEDFCGLVVLALPAISATGMVVGLGTGLAIGTQRWERVWPNAP